MGRPRSEKKRWAQENLKGVENTLLPSFTHDLKSLDEDAIRHDVRQSIAHGFFSMMCATETGLTIEEAKRFVAIAAEEARGRILVTTSLIMNSFEDNLDLLEAAEHAGLNGVLLGYPPTFHPSDKEEIYKATRRICDATRMHVTLYPSPHFPFSRFHSSGFPLDVMERLTELDNVVAVKAGELGLFADIHRRVGQDVLVGCPVERYVPLLVQGHKMQWMGAGCYEVFQSPEKRYLVEYFELLRNGKTDAGMELYWKLAPMRNIFERQFNQIVMTGTYNWHQQKFYQWCVGGNGGLTRQPAMKLHQWEADTIKMGYFAIDIATPDNEEEFYLGRSQFAKLHPEQTTNKNAPPISAPVTTANGSAASLAKELVAALRQTSEEFSRLPLMIRPLLKNGMETRTGESIETWIEQAELLSASLDGADDKIPGSSKILPIDTAALAQLADYFHEAPEQSMRFVKDPKDRERCPQLLSQPPL